MNARLQCRRRSLLAWLVSVVLLGALMSAGCGSESRPAEGETAPSEERAPSFELPAARGGMMSLSQILEGRDAAALVFYRGFF